MTTPSIFLPAPEKAFPTGWHDRLIKAAIHVDDDRAFEHADAWLRANDIDHVHFREHRLLVAVAARFGPRLAEHAAYPRLVGLRRMLWTRSRMALNEARPTLAEIAGAGVEMIPIKGAARVADGSGAHGERIAHDIDIVVRRDDVQTAFDVLIEHGWMPAQGVSHQYVREHLCSMRGVNMFRGVFGDIDLHTLPFHPSQGGAREDAAFWRRSEPAQLAGVPVRLASHEDSLAVSIAHGGLDAYAHSDWLVDIAVALGHRQTDWEQFHEIVEARAIAASALIALTYLADEAELPIPRSLITKLSVAAREKPFAYLSSFVQARPRDRAATAGNAVRGLAKWMRKRAARREVQRAADRCLKVRRIPKRNSGAAPPATLEQRIDIPSGLRGNRVRLRAVLEISVPPVRRRIELEINGAVSHICRVRYRKWDKLGRRLTLAVDGPIEIPPDETSVTLVARPGRLLRDHSGPAERERYGALPFRSLLLEIAADRQ